MRDPLQTQVQRRLALKRILAAAGGLATVLGLDPVRSAVAQVELMTVSGGGVNVKQMPSQDGDSMVPLRESFSNTAGSGTYAGDALEGLIVRRVEVHAGGVALGQHQIGLAVLTAST